MAKYGAGSTDMTNEATTANGAATVFTITDEAKRFLDPDHATVIDYPDNATPVTSYASIQYPGGVVTWAATPGGGDVFITGAYLAVVAVGQCKSWTLDFATEMIDVTEFGDSFRVMTPLITNATATIESFYADEVLFNEMISSSPRLGIDLFVEYDAGTPANCKRYTGYGTLGSTNLSVDAGGVIEQPFTINFSDGPYYVAGLA
jgi:hypothetical protein